MSKSHQITFNEISGSVSEIITKVSKIHGQLMFVESIIEEGIDFFKKNDNFELLFKCQTFKVDFLLEDNKFEEAQTILKEIYNSNE